MRVLVHLMIASTLSAAPLLGQATSERRIPVTKGKPTLPHVDTVRIVIHDTVIVHHTDTLSVFRTATLPPAAPPPSIDTTSKSCNDRYIPIPIPIPFPRGHGSNGGSAAGGGASPATTATPEPATWLLMGTGLAATAAVSWRRRARTNRKRKESDEVVDAED